jgi:hypothetical protein
MELNLQFNRVYSNCYNFLKFNLYLNLNWINWIEKAKVHYCIGPKLAGPFQAGLGSPNSKQGKGEIPTAQGGGASQSPASRRRGGRGQWLERAYESRDRFEVLEERFPHQKTCSMAAWPKLSYMHDDSSSRMLSYCSSEAAAILLII